MWTPRNYLSLSQLIVWQHSCAHRRHLRSYKVHIFSFNITNAFGLAISVCCFCLKRKLSLSVKAILMKLVTNVCFTIARYKQVGTSQIRQIYRIAAIQAIFDFGCFWRYCIQIYNIRVFLHLLKPYKTLLRSEHYIFMAAIGTMDRNKSNYMKTNILFRNNLSYEWLAIDKSQTTIYILCLSLEQTKV